MFPVVLLVKQKEQTTDNSNPQGFQKKKNGHSYQKHFLEFIYLFLERVERKDKEREREKHQFPLASNWVPGP